MHTYEAVFILNVCTLKKLKSKDHIFTSLANIHRCTGCFHGCTCVNYGHICLHLVITLIGAIKKEDEAFC